MKYSSVMLAAICVATASSPAAAAEPLRFDPSAYTMQQLVMPDGDTISFRAYENIYYVTNVEDSTYQTLNLYIPTAAMNRSAIPAPILFRTYIGGFMASKAKNPSPVDATGRALKEGYVVCIAGNRGFNSRVDGKVTGTAPNPLLDLKAAIRYLHYNDDLIPGSSDRIFTDGTSAGGAMSALLGSSGNNRLFEPYLKKMGAADARDDVFASICYCPITDLNHADMEYEWLYGCTNDGARHLDDKQKQISDELAALAPAYINSLHLVKPDGTPLDAGNYREYIGRLIMESAHKALEAGAEIPDTIGLTRYEEKSGHTGDGRAAPSFGPGKRRPQFNEATDFVTAIDLDRYLNYVASVTPLKTPPAFDAYGVIGDMATPENNLFGNEEGIPANFTDFSLQHRTGNPTASLDKDTRHRVYLMNPMNFIGDFDNNTQASHYYIRHGALDRDTSFLVPINLAMKMMMAGFDVNFALPWNRPHSGDYNLDDLFTWISNVMESNP